MNPEIPENSPTPEVPVTSEVEITVPDNLDPVVPATDAVTDPAAAKVEKVLPPPPPPKSIIGKEFEKLCAEEGGAVAEKLARGVQLMKEALHAPRAQWRVYWEVSALTAKLLKERCNGEERKKVLAELKELAILQKKVKADQAKVLADERALLDAALKALEEEFALFQAQVEKENKLEIPVTCEIKEGASYSALQSELVPLNQFARQIHELRKRIVEKLPIALSTKLLARLKPIGNEIFPKRTKLLKELGELFLADIALFEQEAKADTAVDAAKLLKKVEGFQKLAKALAIDKATFEQSRTRLSSCWDHLVKQRKMQKKEGSSSSEGSSDRAAPRRPAPNSAHRAARLPREEVELSESAKKVLSQIQELATLCQNETAADAEVKKNKESLQANLRSTRLTSHELKKLNSELHAASRPYHDRVRAKLDAIAREAEKKIELKKQGFDAVRKEILDAAEAKDVTKRDALAAIINELDMKVLSALEKSELEYAWHTFNFMCASQGEDLEALLACEKESKTSHEGLKKALATSKMSLSEGFVASDLMHKYKELTAAVKEHKEEFYE